MRSVSLLSGSGSGTRREVGDAFREQLLATYADRGEAMAIQTMLEAHQIHCRMEDLARLPSHLFGIAGGLGRSVAIYVLEADAERAASLLTTLGAPENAVDEEALAAEAEAAGMAEPQEADAADEEMPAADAGKAEAAPIRSTAPGPADEQPAPIHPTGSAWRLVLALVAAAVVLLIWHFMT